jgi:DNA-binding MarR family transcriptional regulator
VTTQAASTTQAKALASDMSLDQSDFEHLLDLRTGELISRAVKDGLVRRSPDPTSKSVVRVTLTPAGATKLDALAEAHVEEIAHLAPTMRTLWRQLEHAADDNTLHPAAREPVTNAGRRIG